MLHLQLVQLPLRQLSVKNWKWFSVTSENIFVVMYISSFVGVEIVMCEG